MTIYEPNPKSPRDPPWERDELILVCAALQQNDWKLIRASDPRAMELSSILQTMAIHPLEIRTTKFRSPSSVQRKGADILTQLPTYSGIPTRGGRLDNEVLADFLRDPTLMSSVAEAVRTMPTTELSDPLDTTAVEDFEDEAPEGRLLYRRHRIYERSRTLRLKRIEAAKRTNEGLACQACGFDFAETYGPPGKGYIQVHHMVPLHESGKVRTGLSDLALLCANCHAMAHRARPWPTVSQLQDMVRR
jgi:5-methylcytosine-specific restriction protein A